MKVVSMDALLQQQLSESGVVFLENATGDTATISLFGAQVLSWVSARRGEQLYCSALATTDNGQAIRGGIPVCFPQFSGFGDLPKHGIVRTVVWRQAGEVISGKTHPVAKVTLTLQDNAHTRAHWPHAFSLQLDVSLAEDTLTVSLRVENTGTAPFSFAAALHTYLAQTDVRKATVTALQGQTYVDTTRQPHATCVQTAPALTFAGEVDSIYYAAPNKLTLHHQEEARLQLEADGFKDAVIWNPGPERVKTIPDMTNCDWVKMVCIEAVQFQHPVVLAPGTQWSGLQRLTVL
jgi:glucose-6-phosphate 1-epimerase